MPDLNDPLLLQIMAEGRFDADVVTISRWHPDPTGGGFTDPEVLAALPSSAGLRHVARIIIDAHANAAEK